jgi:hypothetical protein
LACHRIGKSSEVQQKIGQKNIQKSYCPGDREKKNNIARLCSVHQKMVRIGSFWSLFQTFARFIAELFCHQLVLPWLKHGFKKDKSLPWTNIKTINHTAHAYV